MKDFLENVAAANERAVQNKIGRKAPRSSAPLSPQTVNALGVRLKQAVRALSGRDFDVDEVDDEVNQLPPKTFTMLKGVSGFIAAMKKRGISEFDEYDFDAERVAVDGDAMTTTIAMLDRMAKDKSLQPAMRAKPTAEPVEEPVEPAESTATETAEHANYNDLIEQETP